MLIKVSILVVALIGIAAAGQNFQNLFSSSNFPKFFGQAPIVYLVPVVSATAAPATAAPATAAQVTVVLSGTRNQQLTNAIIAAQNVAAAAGYSLRSIKGRTGCTSTPAGVRTWRGMRGSPPSVQCVFCLCSEMISATADALSLANCYFTGCASATAPAQATWTNINSATPWVSLSAAVDYQLYQVDTGYCFVEPYDPSTLSRNMRCYERIP